MTDAEHYADGVKLLKRLQQKIPDAVAWGKTASESGYQEYGWEADKLLEMLRKSEKELIDKLAIHPGRHDR